ncbi:hypothetical protein SLEP1_g33990 [Rubroshorea leprosula]|nr:hypothetical protein SLEP1_g33990 [Rubroshorea leprosula]
MVNVRTKKFPDFFKVYVPEHSSERLHIPDAFVTCLVAAGVVLEKAILRSQTGKIWQVKVNTDCSRAYFHGGWKKFVKDLSLEFGDFLTFRYVKNSLFDFKIFGKSGCEESTRTDCVKNKVRLEEVGDVSMSMEEETGDGHGYKNVSYTEEEEEESDFGDDNADDELEESEHDMLGKEEDEEEEVELRSFVQAKNPTFVVEFAPGRRNELFIKTKLIKDFNLKLEEEISFLDPIGRSWPGKVKKWKDGRTVISGWRAVTEHNFMDEHDRCVCEILLPREGRVKNVRVIKVHIIRGR